MSQQLSGESILLVDDDPSERHIAAAALRREGADVTVARGGIEAAKMTLAVRFDAILTDLHMPLGDGYSLIGAIDPHMRSRVVIVTCCPIMLDGAEGATAFGVGFVLPKPHSPPAIVRAAGLASAAGKQECTAEVAMLPAN